MHQPLEVLSPKLQLHDRHLLQNRFEGRFDSAPETSHVSPLQGAKIVVANLQSSVTQEDILELFGDVGALKRAKIVGRGQVGET